MTRRHTPAYWSSLRTGKMYLGDDKPRYTALDYCIFFAAAGVLGFAIGAMTLPATPAPLTGPGYENCTTKGC